VPKEVTIRTLKWSDDAHQSIHDALYESARAAFIGLLHSGSQTVFRNFYALLTLVLRVRQSCCHGGLVPAEAVAVAEEICRDVDNGAIDLSATEGEALLRKLLDALKGDNNGEDVISKECAVCFEGLEEANAVVLRGCQHVFCNDCLEKVDNQV
jgi:DNA repair protein RAD5